MNKDSSLTESLDVLIVGGGPIGLACAIQATSKGLRSLVIEKGCIANSIYHYPSQMRFFSSSDLLEIGKVPFIIPELKPSRSQALEYYRRVALDLQIPVRLYEKVLQVEGEDGNFTVTTNKQTYTASKVILAIGFFDRARLLNVPGEDLDKVTHYYQEPHPYSGQRVLVVGSGNSAVEAALECHRHGAEVTMAVRSEDFHEGLKYWIRPDIENRIKDGEIAAYFNTQVVEISPDQVLLEKMNARIKIENDFVLALTGYEPDFDFLQRIGIELGEDRYRTPSHNPETYQTNRPGIYMAGVVVGGLCTKKWFIENSRDHATAAVDHLAKQLLKSGKY